MYTTTSFPETIPVPRETIEVPDEAAPRPKPERDAGAAEYDSWLALSPGAAEYDSWR